MWGYIDPGDTKSWLRHLDYYVKLQRMADESLGTVLGALEESGAYDDTIIIFTSDHGDMCGSHGLRSKGPFVYEEIMHVPCYVRAPGITTAGSQSAALATHVDLASTICALGGVDPSSQPSLKGVDLSPVLRAPQGSVRDHVLFAHDTAHTGNINNTRYAIRGFFDGRTKYARYYGVGGGMPASGFSKHIGQKLYDVDAAFEDQEHEWYDLGADPHEMVNLAHDRGRRPELRANFERLLEYERARFA
jgi:arylsulfatase